jgi:hypothetical protein
VRHVEHTQLSESTIMPDDQSDASPFEVSVGINRPP